MHPVRMALQNSERKVQRVMASLNASKRIEDVLGKHRKLLEQVKPEEISKLVGKDSVHQGVAALVEPVPEIGVADFIDETDGKEKCIVVAFDQVSDPHNIGAVIRSAAAFGADAVLLTDRNTPEQTATLAKSSAGTVELVKIIRESNLANALTKLKKSGFFCAGLAGEGSIPLSEFDSPNKLVLIMGSEGEGLRRLTADTCDYLIKIPTSDKVESLNVSNAAAIALYEISKKIF